MGDNDTKPTAMGERILLFMKANGITNRAEFAEKVVGISRQRFHGWLYNEMDPNLIPAAPILRCADVLGTNAEYLLGIHDDPRVETSLTMAEHQLLQAFRDLGDPERPNVLTPDQENLLSVAANWVGRSTEPATASAPFRNLPPPPKP